MYSGIIWVCLNWAFPAPKDFVETCCGLGRGEIFSLRHAGAKRLTIPFQNVHVCAWLCLGELVLQGQISQRNTSPLFFDTYWNWTLRHLNLPSLDSAWNLNNTVTISEVNVTHSDVLRIGSHAGPWGRDTCPVFLLWRYSDRTLQWRVRHHPQLPDATFTAFPHLSERNTFVVSDAGFVWTAEKSWFWESLCHLKEFIQPFSASISPSRRLDSNEMLCKRLLRTTLPNSLTLY